MSRKSREHAAQEAASQAQAAAQQQPAAVVEQAPVENVEPVVQDQDLEPMRPRQRNEPRRLAMEEVVARHERVSGNPEATPEVKVEQAPEPAVPTADQMLQGSKFSPAEPSVDEIPAVTAPAVETVKTVRVKVDGNEFDAPQAEVDAAGGISAYQRDRASDNRLNKANETLAAAMRERAALAEWAQQQIPQVPQPTVDQLMLKVAQARFGTDEEFAASMRAVLTATNPPVDQGALVTQATVTMGYNSARQAFAKEYGDILANPMIAKLAQTIEKETIDPFVQNRRINWGQMAQVDWNVHFSHIGSQLRSLSGPRPSQPQPGTEVTSGTTSQVSSDREARKASIVNLPAAAATRAVLPAEDKPETRAETFNRMRQARGIPTG